LRFIFGTVLLVGHYVNDKPKVVEAKKAEIYIVSVSKLRSLVLSFAWFEGVS